MRVRGGGGPVIVEAATYRWHGHYEGDPQRYRSPGRSSSSREAPRTRSSFTPIAWMAGCPGRMTRSDAWSPPVGPRTRRGGRTARRQPRPRHPRSTFVLAAPSRTTRACPARGRCRRSSGPWTLSEPPSIELASDDRVFVAGIDVGAGGNVFGLDRGPRDGSATGSGTPRSRRRRSWDSASVRPWPAMRPVVEAHVPGLHRRLSRPAAEPGRQAAVHDRRRAEHGAHRAHPVRRRSVVGQPAFAESRGPARPHPGPDRGHARRRPTPTGSCGRPSRTPIRSCSSRIGSCTG